MSIKWAVCRDRTEAKNVGYLLGSLSLMVGETIADIASISEPEKQENCQ